MQFKTIDGVKLHRLFTNGYYNLQKNMTAVNDLNVFPVPDGDTGTNMVQTLSGLKRVKDDISDVGEYMKQLSSNVLLSARGNSGVILSQFIHGLYRGFAEKSEIEFRDFANAFVCATEDSYKAVITPVEGTILTLIREATDFLKKHGEEYEDFESGFKALIEQMKVSLSKTPQLLPILREANVVDSGGAGLLSFMEGIYSYLCGEEVEETFEFSNDASPNANLPSDFGADTVLEFGYCTEFILQLMNYKTNLAAFDTDAFVKAIEPMGDSIVAVHNDGILKIHIHTFTPERVLEYARSLGEFISVKIENMSIQHSEADRPSERVKYATLSVASGQGIIDYFYSIGADIVIDGGQTNNPSVNDFIDKFKTLNAENIIVLPNNPNIIFTANQAAEMYTDTKVTVIPTKSIVEGYSAFSMMNPSAKTVEEFVQGMSEGLCNVTSAYVTVAVRDAVLNGKEVKKDDYIGLNGKTLISKGSNALDTALELIKAITEAETKDVIVVFYGESISEEEANTLENTLREQYPLYDIGFVNGRQSIYDFIISLE